MKINKCRDFKISIHRNNPDGTKTEVTSDKIQELPKEYQSKLEMGMLEVFDSMVLKDDLRESKQVLKYIMEKK